MALLCAPGARAAAATFGADLSRPADSPYTCLHTQLIPTAPTCTVNSTNLSTGESSFPPVGEGTVSAVRVRVGPTTGPMQIVVEQALRQDNPFEAGKPNYACCRAVAMSQVFTPAANAVTTIPVNLRVRQDSAPDENGLYVDQHLGLSVLDPNVPIPASLSAGGANSMGVFLPAWSGVGEEKVGPAASLVNPTVLINADWDPVGAPSAPAADAAPTAVRAVSVLNRQALVANARARIALLCRLETACVGHVLLQSRSGNAAARTLLARSTGRKKSRTKKHAAKRAITYGSVKFRIKPGERANVKVKLNRKGKRLMRKRRRPKVWVNVRIKGHAVQPRRIALKPAPRKTGR